MINKHDEFDQFVVDQLKDSNTALAYLNEHLSYGGPKRLEFILRALHKLTEARGIDEIAKKSKISRRTLYHALSKSGNPTLDTFLKLLDAMGIKISFDRVKVKKRVA